MPFYIERIAEMDDWAHLGLQRSILDYFRSNVYYTGSGELSDRYLHWTKDLVGIDRILYATDGLSLH